MPEGVMPQAKIINFEAAKGKLHEQKTRPKQWIQGRTQQIPL
jgi:hypothetical protein